MTRILTPPPARIVPARSFQMPADHRLPFQAEQSVRDGDRVLVASGGRSRNRDWWTGKAYRLSPPGMRLEGWLQNRQMLWMHNMMIPLGRANLFKEDGRLWADELKFHKKKIPVATQNWIGDAIGEVDTAAIAELWEEKWLSAVSVHVIFDMDDEENITEDDEEIFFPTSEVIEFSIVTVPGDRDAVRQRMENMGLQPQVAMALLTQEDLQPEKPIYVYSRQKMEAPMHEEQSVEEEVEEVFEEEDAGESRLAQMVAGRTEKTQTQTPAQAEPAVVPQRIEVDLNQLVEAIAGSEALVEAVAGRVVERVMERLGGPLQQARPAAYEIHFVRSGVEAAPVSDGVTQVARGGLRQQVSPATPTKRQPQPAAKKQAPVDPVLSIVR